jgi:hypothetical protein
MACLLGCWDRENTTLPRPKMTLVLSGLIAA